MSDSIVAYGVSDCPSCLRACADLMDLYPSVEYVFVNCDFSPAYRSNLKKKYSFPTFPIVVLVSNEAEQVIGGYRELSAWIESTRHNRDYPPPPIRDKD